MGAILIPGWLIALATFPGVILHVYTYKRVAMTVGLQACKVVYFRIR